MEREPFYGTDDPPFYGEFSIGGEDVSLKKGVFLPDEEYAELLDNVTVPCTDIVVLDANANVLLARRAYEPAINLLWNQGGRIMRGRHPRANAQLILKRELGMMLPLGRFHYFGANSFMCVWRAQPPQKNGSHTAAFFFYVVLTEEEKTLVCAGSEYAQGSEAWYSLADVGENFDLHPSIIGVARFFLHRYRRNAMRRS